ncbi:MAG: carboxypeptidase-like regulatory domain-containing protein [Gemmatimonadetes bacterium]|nr:carboxypeptidase-like regulatory domain-containing protein [Gemmatimonadota bacterium]
MSLRPSQLRVVLAARWRATRCAGLLACSLLGATSAAAQAQLSEVRGAVLDSASRAPVPAAVVMLLDASGSTLYRVLTSERGIYRILRPAEATHLRVVRLGFQPATVPLSQARPRAEGGYDLEVRLLPFARTLQSVDVSAARGCPSRPDRASALALLDAARAGLLATVVAREKDPPRVQVLRFDRVLDADGLATVSQTVRVDSSAGATISFNAAYSADRFLTSGFRSGANGDYTFFGPDADVLLSEAFQNGYCFATAPPEPQRATQVGLRFTPAGRRSGRVDIDGTLWIDTVQRTLVDIDFKYLGLDALAEGLGAGGRITFRALPNGVPFIERWHLRLIGANPVAERTGSVQSYIVREVGGELADARWSDGRVWQAPLASVHLSAVSAEGTGVAGAVLRLTASDYRATSDASGRAIIAHVLPGPYGVEIDDPSLRPLRLPVPTTRTITAQRGSAILSRVEITGALGVVRQRCNRTDTPKRDETWLLGRVLTAAGEPLEDVKWQVLEAEEGKWRPRTDVGTTGSTGIVALCKGLERGTTIEVAAWHPDGDTVRVRQVLDQPLAIVPLLLPARVVANARRTAPTGPLITISGTVTDSASGRVVADARVTVRGTRLEGASDETGQFVIGGVAAGDATLEVGTPALDSLGIVARRDVRLADGMPPLRLFAPSMAEAIRSACGENRAATSLIVGRLAPRSGRAVVLAGYRVIAEWEADTVSLLATDSLGQSRLGGWAQATPDLDAGTWHVCGVPAGRRVTVRAEADRMFAGGALPVAFALDPARPVRRADLLLDSAIVAAPTFSGAVLADSAGTPIENAEITLRDIGRSVLTDRRGQFRFGELPEGPHLVSIRAVGYAPWTGTVQSIPGQAAAQRVLLERIATGQTLAAVSVTAEGVPEEFSERKALGLGAYITRDDLARQNGRRFSEVMSTVRGFGNVQGNGGHAYIVGRRAPTRMTSPVTRATGVDGDRAQPCGGRGNPCAITTDDLASLGYYCPTAAERLGGLPACACFARVYVDDRLMNPGKPTEPFDVNTLQVDQIAGVEFYASAATTPARYSQLDAVCGVMLVWLRRS